MTTENAPEPTMEQEEELLETPESALVRLADAAERIADALEDMKLAQEAHKDIMDEATLPLEGGETRVGPAEIVRSIEELTDSVIELADIARAATEPLPEPTAKA